MKLEQQVTSLELSKRLKELGAKTESHFRWYQRKYGNNQEPFVSDRMFKETPNWIMHGNAYSVAELGTMLLKANYKDLSKAYHHLHKRDDIDKFDLIEHMQKPRFGAVMIIYLLENNLVTL